MNIKKNQKKNLERFKVFFFVIGINLTLALVWTAFEYKQYDPLQNNIAQEMTLVKDMEMVEITKQVIKQPEPPKVEIIRSAQIKITDEKVDDLIEIFNFEDENIDDIDEYKGKSNDEKEIVETEVYRIVQEMPEFPGGEAALFEFIGENTLYPAIAKNATITGNIYISFVVEKDGSITNVKKAEDTENIGGGCLEESMRVVKLMPNWKPGKQRGNAVRVSYVLPFEYTLTGN